MQQPLSPSLIVAWRARKALDFGVSYLVDASKMTVKDQ